jgi:CRP/FNR family transcriptional regulator
MARFHSAVEYGMYLGMDTASFVAHVPLFEGLPAVQIERLSSIATQSTFMRGRTIFSEGEEADGFYVVMRGRVKIFKVSSGGKEQVLHVVGFQEPFGEVPVFAGGRFPAHAEALDDTVALFFPRPAFVRLIENDPSLAMNMLALLSRRLRQFAGLIEGLSLKEVPGRLAAYLVYLSDRSGGDAAVELDISKALLANILGTIPATLSRILAKMASEGLITVRGRKITLRDRKRLEELSSGTGGL